MSWLLLKEISDKVFKSEISTFLWKTGCFPKNLLSPLLNAFSHLVYAFKDVLLEYIKLSLKSKIKSLIYKASLMHLPITVVNMESAYNEPC